MTKYLYFASAAPDGTAATEEVACFPASQMSHFEMASATQLRVYFHSNQEQDLSSVDSAHAVLTITTGKHKEVIEGIINAITTPYSNSASMVVVADSENSVFAHQDITACASIAVVDAS